MTPFLTTFTCSHFCFPIHGNYFVTDPQHSIHQIVLFLCKAENQLFSSFQKTFTFSRFFIFLEPPIHRNPVLSPILTTFHFHFPLHFTLQNQLLSPFFSLLRLAEVAREHGWHPPKSLNSDENFKPEHTLFCRELRFVAIYALFLEIFGHKKCLFG